MFERCASGLFSVYQADGMGPAAHTFYEVEQVFLIRVGGVAADGGYRFRSLKVNSC